MKFDSRQQWLDSIETGLELVHESLDCSDGELGLVDEFGSASYVAREVIEAEDIIDFTREPDLLERLTEAGYTKQQIGELLWQFEPTRVAHRLKPETTWLY